jgi:siroheme synthase-like protein
VSGYPIVLDGSTLDALVVGGGKVATRKVRGLLASGAAVRVVAREVDSALREMSDPRLTIEQRDYAGDDIGDALLVVAATSARDVNARIAADARARGRLINVADAPEEGNFVTAAVHRAGELIVAVTAGGVPAAAARVRDCIGARFGARYAAAVRQLSELRSATLAAGDRAGWGRMLDALVGDDFCEVVEGDRFMERVARWR